MHFPSASIAGEVINSSPIDVKTSSSWLTRTGRWTFFTTQPTSCASCSSTSLSVPRFFCLTTSLSLLGLSVLPSLLYGHAVAIGGSRQPRTSAYFWNGQSFTKTQRNSEPSYERHLGKQSRHGQLRRLMPLLAVSKGVLATSSGSSGLSSLVPKLSMFQNTISVSVVQHRLTCNTSLITTWHDLFWSWHHPKSTPPGTTCFGVGIIRKAHHLAQALRGSCHKGQGG